MSLTSGQRQRLERLWFVYGNYGPKTTPGNHSFIQGLLEQGLDLRPLITKRSRKSEISTPECEAAVDEALAQRETRPRSWRASDRKHLASSRQCDGNSPPVPDSSWEATLDSMKGHGHVEGMRFSKGTARRTPLDAIECYHEVMAVLVALAEESSRTLTG